MPLAPFITVAAALAIVTATAWINRNLRGLGTPVGTVVVLLAIVACVRGANYYYDIRWQHGDRIRLWKHLNQLVPPDKPLLTFDPVMDNIITEQSEAKGVTMRAEPAWYIDRRIEQNAHYSLLPLRLQHAETG